MPVSQRIRRRNSLSVLMMCVGTIACTCVCDLVVAGDPGLNPAQADPAKVLVDALVRLDSSDLTTRIEAHRELFQNEAITLRQLTQALGRPDLSSEQRSRLNDVAYARFRRSPRAALGVSYLENQQVERIIIDAPLTNWDSARVLRPGDALVTIDGHMIAKQDDVRISVLSHDPGDQVAVVFERDGVVMRSMVRLGNFADLNDQRVTLDRDTYPQAWHLRLERELGSGKAGERAVEAGLKSRDLSAADRALRAAMLTPPRRLEMASAGSEPGTITIVPEREGEAGEDRTLVHAGTTLELTSQSFVSLDPARHASAMRRSRGPGNGGDQGRVNADPLAGLREQTQRELRLRVAAIKEVEARLADPRLNREQRAEAKQLIKTNQERVRELELRLMQLGQPAAVPPAPKAP